MTLRTMYKITIHYVSPLPRVSDGDGFSGLELARVKLNPRHRCGASSPDTQGRSYHTTNFCLFMF